MATALKLKNDIKKLKAAINSKATPKTFVPKLKAQLERAEKELADVKSGGKPKKSSAPKTEKTLTALQKLVQKKKFSVYKGAGVDLKKDAGEGAMKTGKRISKGLKSNQWGDKSSNKGNVYYEYRPNRLDVKQPKKKQTYPKLEKGGYADGGKLESGVYRVGKPMKVSQNLYEQKIVEIFDNGDIATASDYARKISDFKLQKYPMISKDKLDAQNKMASGGSVKSGESVAYIIWVSKDGDKREFHGEYKSKKAADMAMNKLWDSGEYESMGNKPKSMYEKDGLYAKGGKLNAGHKIKYQGKDAKIVSQKGDMYFVEVMNYHPNGDSMFTVLRAEEIEKFAAGGYMADGGEVKFEVDDVVYHKGYNTIGIVRMAEERGEVKTDADGNVNVDELEYYNPIKYPKHQSANIAPSTKKEIEDRGLWKPFSDRTSKFAAGGELHRTQEFKDGGSVFSEKELKEILDESLPHFFRGQNQIGLAMRYLEVKGQGGMKTALSNKLNIDGLNDSIEKIEQYVSK
jgi:hypothetical protein